MKMKLIPIEVECHSGYKADEYPKSFILDNQKFDVHEITDRWYQAHSDPEYPASDYFKVDTTVGLQFILKHDLETDRWYVCKSLYASDSLFGTN